MLIPRRLRALVLLIAPVMLVAAATGAFADIVNGDFSDTNLNPADFVFYGDGLDNGWHGENAGSVSGDYWRVINGMLEQTEPDTATRIGQGFSADNYTGTGWRLVFDLDGTIDRVTVWAGVDDQTTNEFTVLVDNRDDDGPATAIITASSWTKIVEEFSPTGDQSIDIAENLSDFDIMVIQFRGTNSTVGAKIDNIRFVPEPTSFALAMIGLFGLMECVRRRRK